jgi:hypothetical protein
VSAGLTPEGVAALAPDAKVAAAGRKLGAPKSWQSSGRSADALWGVCRGSTVYQVRVDLSDLAVKCSCPSRKHPCKHGIGLLYLSLETPPSEAPPPDWVTDWLARRAARKRAGASAETAPDPEAKEKRAKKQLSRVAAGLEALDLWMEDLVRGGLAQAGMRPPSFWARQAKRMVDAQAPGVAARLRRLSGLPNTSPDWPEAPRRARAARAPLRSLPPPRRSRTVSRRERQGRGRYLAFAGRSPGAWREGC